MASCSKCGKNVGCGCNLVGGLCLQCYSVNSTISTPSKKKSTYKKVVSYSQPDAKPLEGFEEILQIPNISKEEKIRRINEILEKAKQQL